LLCLLNIFAMNTCFWHVSFHEGPDQCVNALQVLFSSHDFDCMVYLGWNCVLLDFMISLLCRLMMLSMQIDFSTQLLTSNRPTVKPVLSMQFDLVDKLIL